MDSLSTNSFNQCQRPVVDCNGRPFTPDCRVRYCLPSYYINTTSGKGRVKNINMYGGVHLETDTPENHYDRSGFIVRTGNDFMGNTEYQYGGEYQGKQVAAGRLGDPFEHGTVRTYIEIIDEE